MAEATMERISLKLTKEEVKGGRRLRPEGTYFVTIEEVEFTQSKNGNPMYVFTYEIIDGPEGGTNGTIKQWAVLTEAAKFTIVDIMRATGFPLSEEIDIPAADEFIGKELAFDILHEARTEGKGKDKVQVLNEETGEVEMTDNIKRVRSTAAAKKNASAKGNARAKVRKI